MVRHREVLVILILFSGVLSTHAEPIRHGMRFER